MLPIINKSCVPPQKKENSMGEKNSKNDFYYPSEEIKAQANFPEYENLYERSIKDREGFWAEQAEHL